MYKVVELARYGSHTRESGVVPRTGAHRLAEDRCADAPTRTRTHALEHNTETSDADVFDWLIQTNFTLV